MKMAKNVTRLALGLAAVGVVGGFLGVRLSSGGPRSGGSIGPATDHGRVGFAVSSERKSIGDMIDESDIVARAVVVEVGKPYWNSANGQDWSEEYRKDPSAYLVPPIPVIPVKLSIKEIFYQGGGTAPAVTAGALLEATFLSTSLVEGEERIFFLRWTDLHLSSGSLKIWYGDEGQGTWYVEGNRARPASLWQAYSVASAVMTDGSLGVIDGRTYQGSLYLAAFKTILLLETAKDGVDIAGFAQWPYEPAYEEYISHVVEADPSGAPDPSEV